LENQIVGLLSPALENQQKVRQENDIIAPRRRVPIIQFSLYFLQNVKSLTTKPASRRINKNSLLQKQINVNKQIF
jgi:hypothetical protein